MEQRFMQLYGKGQKAFPFAGKQSDQICGLFSGASGQVAGNDFAGMHSFIILPGGIPEKTEIQAQSFKAGTSGITLAAVKAAAALGCKRFYRSRIPGRVRSAGSGQDFTRKRGKSHNSLRSGKAGIRISGKDALQGTGNRVYLAQNIQCLWNL